MSLLRQVNSWLFDKDGNGIGSVLSALKVSMFDGDGNKLTSTSNALNIALKDGSANSISSTNNKLNVISEEFLLEVQKGNVPGHLVIWKFGFSDTNVTSGFNTVRAGSSGLYNYAIGFDTNADTVDITSTDPTNDNGIEITIDGLDANGDIQQISTTVGSTTIETWSRVFRAYNSNGAAFTGDVTISDTTTSTNLAFISSLDQQTLQAMYTVPKGYTGYLFQGELAIGGSKEAELNFVARLKDHVFRTVEKLIIYQNTSSLKRPYNPLPELTDVEVRIKPNTNNSLVTSSFGLLLVAN